MLRVSLRIDHFASLHIRGHFLTTANVSLKTFRTGDAIIFFHAVVSNLGGNVLLFPHFGSSGLIVAINTLFLKLESL